MHEPGDPALAKMASLVGGKWVLVSKDDHPFIVEHSYELAMNGKAVRGIGVIGKGSPQATPVETLYGWDPVQKKTYYFDFHGHDTVYKGTVTAEQNSVSLDFDCIVGAPGKFRARIDFVDKDTFNSVIEGKRGDKWVDLHTFVFKRQ